jgi:hypothetical protein
MKKKGYLPLSDNAVNMVKALKHNREFVQFILQKRLKEPIKIAHSDKAAKEYINKWNGTPPEGISKSILKDSIISETIKHYNVDSDLIKQIPTIIRYGCIFLPLLQPEIKVVPEYKEVKAEAVDGKITYKDSKQIQPQSININVSANMSINQIKKFLDTNRDQLERQLAMLQDNTFEISEKEYKIFNLRALKPAKPHKEIAAELSETEENVKKIYSNTRKKIFSLFSPKR